MKYRSSPKKKFCILKKDDFLQTDETFIHYNPSLERGKRFKNGACLLDFSFTNTQSGDT